MDTIYSERGSKAAVLTIVDRATCLLATTKLENLSQSAFLKGFSRLIADFPGPIRTVAVDHGKEFSCDQALTKFYGIPVYFCHAYHPNERFNRELRQYFPKGTKFDKTSEAIIQYMTNLINNKPRKCLRQKTPMQTMSKPLSKGNFMIAIQTCHSTLDPIKPNSTRPKPLVWETFMAEMDTQA